MLDESKWKTYFKLIDPLMSEEAEYIRQNLGSFAIGDSLLTRFPEKVLTASQKWIKSDNPNVRWNVAMIFTAAAARRYASQGKVLLKALENDPEPTEPPSRSPKNPAIARSDFPSSSSSLGSANGAA